MVVKFYRFERHYVGEHGNLGILNLDLPTRLPGNDKPSSPDVSLASASLITSTNWQTKMNVGSDHLLMLISLQMDVTINPIHRSSINLKKANWDRYSREIEDKLSKRRIPTNGQRDLACHHSYKAASHHIPSGRHRLNNNIYLILIYLTQSRFQQRYWKR